MFSSSAIKARLKQARQMAEETVGDIAQSSKVKFTQGVAQAVIGALLDTAKEAGGKKLEQVSNRDNLYKSLGLSDSQQAMAEKFIGTAGEKIDSAKDLAGHLVKKAVENSADTREKLVAFSFEKATKDGREAYDEDTDHLLYFVTCKLLGLTEQQFEAKKEEYGVGGLFNYLDSTASDDPYAILDLDETASIETIALAVTKIQTANHPDKLSGQSEAQKKAGEERFKDANNAWDRICRDRGENKKKLSAFAKQARRQVTATP